MFTAIKKQLHDYQVWLDIATDIDLTPYKAINRMDFITFMFILTMVFFGYFLTISFHPNLTLFAMIMHIVLGTNILQARAIVSDALDDIESYRPLNSRITQFLNRQYSLFLVSQGKNPLNENQIKTLENHTIKYIEGKITRSGRNDSIKRFKIAFLKREKMFFTILFIILTTVELFVVF